MLQYNIQDGKSLKCFSESLLSEDILEVLLLENNDNVRERQGASIEVLFLLVGS